MRQKTYAKLLASIPCIAYCSTNLIRTKSDPIHAKSRERMLSAFPMKDALAFLRPRLPCVKGAVTRKA